MKAKKGISLIVLVITIIVIIILAGAVILSLSNNNPIGQANFSTFLSDRSNIQDAITLDVLKQFADAQPAGSYDVSTYTPTVGGDVATMITNFQTKFGVTTTITDGKLLVTATEGTAKDYIMDSTATYDWLTKN
ncbi:MAG: hypothetical protein N2749_00145 [Clostridia bacterium]|nr:hypothetical protein [Clostridia bacterium]